VLKLEDIHPHWRFTKPPQTRQATARQEDHAKDDEDVTEVQGTPPGTPSSPPEDRTLPDDILRVQEPAIVKPKGRSRGSLNKAWAAPSQSRRRRQIAFANSTQRTPSAFELTPDLPSSQVPDSQPRTQSQRGGRGGRRRGERGDARGTTAEGQISGVPTSYMGSFQM